MVHKSDYVEKGGIPLINPIKEIKTFMKTVKKREDDLLGYYDTFVTNASAESLNSKNKAFRSELHGVSSLSFFFYRVCKIFG